MSDVPTPPRRRWYRWLPLALAVAIVGAGTAFIKWWKSSVRQDVSYPAKGCLDPELLEALDESFRNWEAQQAAEMKSRLPEVVVTHVPSGTPKIAEPPVVIPTLPAVGERYTAPPSIPAP